MKDWKKEFFTQFGADKIWVKPSKENVQTIFDIENFIEQLISERDKEILEIIENELSDRITHINARWFKDRLASKITNTK